MVEKRRVLSYQNDGSDSAVPLGLALSMQSQGRAMNTLQGEVIKLIGNETLTTDAVTERLNRNGWNVKHDDVLDALHRLEVQGNVERLWRRRLDISAKKTASV